MTQKHQYNGCRNLTFQIVRKKYFSKRILSETLGSKFLLVESRNRIRWRGAPTLPRPSSLIQVGNRTGYSWRECVILFFFTTKSKFLPFPHERHSSKCNALAFIYATVHSGFGPAVEEDFSPTCCRPRCAWGFAFLIHQMVNCHWFESRIIFFNENNGTYIKIKKMYISDIIFLLLTYIFVIKCITLTLT
jgi:hypothetical protein